MLLLHGLPGNEKNLDLGAGGASRRLARHLDQLSRIVGQSRHIHVREQSGGAAATLAFLRDPANAKTLGIDPSRIVLAGHMGGWVTALTAAADPALAGAILISAGDMGGAGSTPRGDLVKRMADNMETLSGTTPTALADELIAHADRWVFDRAAGGLAHLPLLVLTSDDGRAPAAEQLVSKVRASGDTRVMTHHESTDHSWSDKRVALESLVIQWLQNL